MTGLRKVVITGDLITGLLADGVRLARRGPLEVVGGLPEGARLVWAEVDRTDPIEGDVSLELIFEHESWGEALDGSVPTITPSLQEVG